MWKMKAKCEDINQELISVPQTKYIVSFFSEVIDWASFMSMLMVINTNVRISHLWAVFSACGTLLSEECIYLLPSSVWSNNEA